MVSKGNREFCLDMKATVTNGGGQDFLIDTFKKTGTDFPMDMVGLVNYDARDFLDVWHVGTSLRVFV